MSNGSPYSKPTSIPKIIFVSLVGFILLIALCLLLLPSFFSTSTGKKLLVNIISNKSGSHLEIDELSLSWFGKQQATGIRLEKISDTLLFTCQSLLTDASLIDLLFKSDLGRVSVKEPYLQLAKAFHSSMEGRKTHLRTAGFPANPSMHLTLSGFNGTISVEKGKARFNPPGVAPIDFDQIAATMVLEQSRDEISWDLSCLTSEGQAQGEIAIKGSVIQVNSPLPQIAIEANLKQLPVQGIDQLITLFNPKMGGLLYASLGSTMDMQCNVVAIQGNFDINLALQSPQINGSIATQTAKGEISLKNPATLNFNLTPALFEKIATIVPSLKPLKLTQAALFQGTIPQFSCPIPRSEEDLQKASFQANIIAPSQMQWTLNAKPLMLNNLKLSANSASIGELIAFTLSTTAQTQMQSGLATIEGGITHPFSQTGSVAGRAIQLPVDLIGVFLESPIALSSVLGPQADIAISLQWAQQNPILQLSWASQFLNLPSFELSLGTPLKLLSPTQFTLSINPQLIPKTQFKLIKVNPIQGVVQAFDANGIQGRLSSTEAIVGSDTQQVTIQNTSLPFQWDSKTKTASFELTSQVQNPSGHSGSALGQMKISNFSMIKNATLTASLELQNLSSLLLDSFTGKTVFSAVMGPLFSGKLKLQSGNDKGQLAIKWISPLLNIDAAFAINPTSIELLSSANQMSWTLTPDSYRILDQAITGPKPGMLPFELKENTTFSIVLNKLSLPITPQTESGSITDRIPNISIDLNKLELSAQGRNPSLTFFDIRSKEAIQLTNFVLSINQSPTLGPLTASLESNVTTQQESGTNPAAAIKNGSLSILAKLKNTQNDQAGFDLSQLTANIQMKALQLPSRALDIIARANGRADFPFTTLFGEMINASFSSDLNNFAGPIALNINTPMTRLDLAGHLVGGALLLNNPLFAQVKITPELSRLVLKEVNPLNLSYIYSQAPVTLEIPPDGFYFPIYPFATGKIAIPDATVELGKISCRNEGNVNITLGLLKTKQFDKSGELSLWFAPIDLRVKQGLVDIDRTEILLANTFDVCVWGKVDLIQNYVDMVLGLTSQTLQKAFGIKNLPENYVLTIPMKGPADNVQINSGKATAKVALLLAWQNKNIAGAFGGGPAGAIVGDFLGKIATLPDADVKVPPAKHPFPWEIGKGGKTSQTSHIKKRKFKAKDKPLKQIFKVIR